MVARPTIAVLGTFDTKGKELAYLADAVRAEGVDALTIDCGVMHPPTVRVDVTSEQVARAAGHDVAVLRSNGERGAAMTAMAQGAKAVVERLEAEGRVDGLIGIGGSNGRFLTASAAAALPFGAPKVIVSTMVSHDTKSVFDGRDVTLMYSVLDLAGLNSLLRSVLRRAAAAVAAMARCPPETPSEALPVAATMAGVTTDCVTSARQLLEAQGADVHVFHANGDGGLSYERTLRQRMVRASLDLTLTEIADEVGGGICSAGPDRLEAAVAARVPQVVAPGGVDLIKFGRPSTVPKRFRGRQVIAYNATATLVRTNCSENAAIGRYIGGKLAHGSSRTVIALPLGGLSQLDVPGLDWSAPEANASLFDAIHSSSGPTRIVESVHHVNDEAFARLVVDLLTDLTSGSDHLDGITEDIDW